MTLAIGKTPPENGDERDMVMGKKSKVKTDFTLYPELEKSIGKQSRIHHRIGRFMPKGVLIAVNYRQVCYWKLHFIWATSVKPNINSRIGHTPSIPY